MLAECNTKGGEARPDSEIETWFATPGDIDDFIFYGDDRTPQSEK